MTQTLGFFVVAALFTSGQDAQTTKLPDGVKVAMYAYVIRHYGQAPLNPLADPVQDRQVLDKLIAQKLSARQSQGYVRAENVKVLARTQTRLTVSLRLNLDRAKDGAGTCYEGRMGFTKTGQGWQLAFAKLDRFDDLGLDDKSEIAAYRFAISKCPAKTLISLPQNTSDRVFLPLRKSNLLLGRGISSDGTIWNIAITLDHPAGSTKCADLDLFASGKEAIAPEKRIPIVFSRRDGRVICRALSTSPLPAHAEAKLLLDAVVGEKRRVFVDAPKATLDILKSHGLQAEALTAFKEGASYAATGFIRVERPFVRWITKDHALVTLETYFMPSGGDVAYSYGGPYDLQWIKGKLHLKKLKDQWGGE